MASPALQRAHQKLAEARRAAGKRAVSAWLSEPARQALDALAKVHGSREAALEALLLGAAKPAPAAPAEKPKGKPRGTTPAHAGKRFRGVDPLTNEEIWS